MSIDENIKIHIILKDARELYEKQGSIYCPYFDEKIILNSDGFNHLQNKTNRQHRPVAEQIYKIGKKGNDGFYKTKRVQYWGFVAILENNATKIKIILKKIGDGNVMFWSVMLIRKKLFQDGIEDD